MIGASGRLNNQLDCSRMGGFEQINRWWFRLLLKCFWGDCFQSDFTHRDDREFGCSRIRVLRNLLHRPTKGPLALHSAGPVQDQLSGWRCLLSKRMHTLRTHWWNAHSADRNVHARNGASCTLAFNVHILRMELNGASYSLIQPHAPSQCSLLSLQLFRSECSPNCFSLRRRRVKWQNKPNAGRSRLPH